METILTNGQVPLPIDKEICARLENGRADTFLLIVPTAHARLKWQRECLDYAPNRAAAGLHIHTLEDLVQRFYRRIGAGRRQISVGLQTIWMRQILDRGELPFLKPHPEIPVPQGTVTRLTSAINQLKGSGIDPSQLQGDLIQSEEVERGKLTDLTALYEAYEGCLSNQWADRAGVHRAVSNDLSTSPSRTEKLMTTLFPDVDLVIVSGFDVFSPPDLSILTGIANLPPMKMGIVLDFDEQNESLFGHVKENYDQLLSVGFQTSPPAPLLQGEWPGEGSSQSRIRNQHFAQNLFRKDRWLQSSDEKLELTKQMTLVQVSDRVQEVEQIARLIKQFVLHQPALELHRVCITFYNLDIYAPLIREIFPIYGIPYAMDWDEGLTNSPIVVSIFALLDVIEGNASPRNRRKVLQSPYFSIDDWSSMIDNCELKTEMPPHAFSAAFDQLMETLNVRQQVLKGSWEEKTLLAVHEINAYRRFRALIDELVNFLMVEYDGERHHRLNAYVNWLRLMASQTTYQWGNLDNDGVCILPLVQTKELDFDIVILGGLVNGDFPAVFRPDAFLHPRRSRSESDRLREDRFLFYQALKLYRKHLYLIAPQRDGEIELVQSSFIDELRRVADIHTLQDNTTALFSTESFLKDYGKFAWESAGERMESGKEEKSEISILPSFPSSLPSPPSTLLPLLDLIEHNVRVEKSRTVTHDLPQYEGWLIRDLLSRTSRRALEERREGVYSVSQLESYGRCPFQYFSDRVLRLNRIEEEEEEEGLTNRERGSLLHAILFEFYDRRRDEPPISACTDSEFEAAVQELREIARKHLSWDGVKPRPRHGGLFWEIDVETLIGGHGRTGVLPAFLEAERARKFEVHPQYFEVEFGSSGRPGQIDPILGSNAPIAVGEVSLSGKIDRIEVGDGFFIVGDYKTGRENPKIRDILEGRSLQLPIYIAVAEQLLKGRYLREVKGVGGVYYVLREDSKAELGIGDKAYDGRAFKASSRSGQLLPNSNQGIEDTQMVIDLAVEYVNRYVGSIASGEFPLTSHDKQLVCRYCSFKKICRVGEILEETG